MDEFAGLKKKSKKKTGAPAGDVALPGADELAAKEQQQQATEPPATSSPAVSSKPEDDAVRPLDANANLTGSDNVLDDFADLKKKKKKKAVALDLEEVQTPTSETPAETATAPPAEPADDFADLVKKKKKKKVTLDVGEETAATPSDAPAAEGAAHDLDFSDIKRKKKSKKTVDLDAFAKEIEETTTTPAASSKPAKIANGADNSDDDGDFDGEVNDDDVPEGEDPFATGDGPEGEAVQKSRAELANEAQAWISQPDRDYEYIELLGHFYAALYASHPALSGAGGRKRFTIPPPSMHRDGNKRSVFANVSDICKRMKRQPEHVIQFLFAELGTTGSVDGSSRLIIKGRFQQKQIESVLRRYIVEYVTCKTCKSPDTLLAKENRLYFVTCQSCGSHRSVSAIQAGFKAQIAKRRAQAAKAAG